LARIWLSHAVRHRRDHARRVARVSVAPLISDRFDLSEGATALEHARTKPVLKVLLDVARS
jgi:hypothetical protein